MDSRLEDITLPTLGMLRDVANSALSDAIFYMQNRGKLLETVYEKLEKLVCQIRKHLGAKVSSKLEKQGLAQV